MRINVKFDEKQASENISKILKSKKENKDKTYKVTKEGSKKKWLI